MRTNSNKTAKFFLPNLHIGVGVIHSQRKSFRLNLQTDEPIIRNVFQFEQMTVIRFSFLKFNTFPCIVYQTKIINCIKTLL